MRKRNLILIVLLLAVLMIAGAVWVVTRPAKPLKVTASFIGFTNNLAGIRLARFKVTNHSGVHVFRSRVYRLDTEQQNGFDLASGSNSHLAPEESEVIDMRAPTNQVRWRAGIFVSNDNWRTKLAFFVSGLPRPMLNLLPVQAQDLPSETAFSDWVDP